MADIPTFDPNSPKYQFGCGFHVTIGIKIACVVDIIVNFAHCALVIEAHRLFVFIFVAIFSIFFLTPFVAIKKLNSKWMIPYLTLCVIGLIYQIGTILYFIGYHFAGNIFVGDDRVLNLAFMELGICGISTIMAFRCYQYLYELQKASQTQLLSNV